MAATAECVRYPEQMTLGEVDPSLVETGILAGSVALTEVQVVTEVEAVKETKAKPEYAHTMTDEIEYGKYLKRKAAQPVKASEEHPQLLVLQGYQLLLRREEEKVESVFIPKFVPNPELLSA